MASTLGSCFYCFHICLSIALGRTSFDSCLCIQHFAWVCL